MQGPTNQTPDAERAWMIDDPVVREIIETGVDVTSFSGDKLLGSVQAGLIVGTHAIVTRLRKHPLYRALRSDKIRLAALEATLVSHQKDMAQAEVPVIQMLSLTNEELRQRAQEIAAGLSSNNLSLELLDGESALGGGAGPTSTFPTTLIAITHSEKSAQDIEHQLRTFSPPIISRISEGKVLLDLRTVFENHMPDILRALNNL